MSKGVPKIIEFAGLPAAGKTTIIQLLEKYLRDRNINCQLIGTASTVSPISNYKTDWTFDVWSICRSIMKLIEVSNIEDNEWIIVERGLIDSLCWLKWFRDSGHITTSEFEIIKEFALIAEWLNKIDLVIVLQVELATALARGRTPGRVVNHAVYKELRCAYDTTIKEVQSSKHIHNIVMYETDEMSPSTVCKLLLERLVV
ncbi:MAG: hypothetical protein AAGF93_17300 [Cyanobacteria bacterium P01_H01_bin.105]